MQIIFGFHYLFVARVTATATTAATIAFNHSSLLLTFLIFGHTNQFSKWRIFNFLARLVIYSIIKAIGNITSLEQFCGGEVKKLFTELEVEALNDGFLFETLVL